MIRLDARSRSVVGVPFVATLRAGIEDRASFVGGSELLRIVPDFFAAAFAAGFPDHGVGLHIGFVDFLDI